MANWYIFDASGKKWGPITKTRLEILVARGKIAPEALVESPDGWRGEARYVKGITFPQNTVSVPSVQAEHTMTPFILGGVCACLILLVAMVFGGLFSLGFRDSTVAVAEPLPNMVEQVGNHVEELIEEPIVFDEDVPIDAIEVAEVEAAPARPNVPKSIEEIVKQSENSVARIKTWGGSGSGFLIRPNVVVTNKHVIENEFLEFVEITFPSAPEAERGPHKTKLLYIDPEWDIAFLEVQTPLPPLPLAFPHQFGRGRDIVVIGSPGAASVAGGVLENAISIGVLSSQAEVRGQMYYQSNVSTNPGNSGGPVINRYGEVIGMHTLGLGRTGVMGIAFCISINDVMASLLEMEELTDEEKDGHGATHQARVNSIHRASVAFGKLTRAHRNYLASIELIVTASNRADSMGLPRRELDAMIRNIQESMRENDLRDDELLEIRRVLRDANLYDSLRRDLNAFFLNCMDIKGYVNNPGRLGPSYSSRLTELRGAGSRLKFRLQLDLGMPGEE